MTDGYTLPRPSDGSEPGDGFEWDVPEPYNIAGVALDNPPSAVALGHVGIDGDRHRFDYGELDRASDALAAYLRSAGVDREDRVAVCLPQCPEALVAHLAIYKLAAVSVPMSMLLGEDTFRYQLSHAGATVLIVDDRRGGGLSAETVEPVDAVLPVAPGANGYDGKTAALGGFSAVVEPERVVDAEPTSIDDPALILYTSGTSGDPKGVLQGHGYLLGSLPGYQCCYHLFDDEDCRSAVVWSPSEWAWAGALFDVVFPTLAVGGTVLSTERRSGFDPDTALARLERESVTHAFFPPTALARIRAEATPGDYDLSSLRTVMCGGEKLPQSVFEWAEAALGIVVNEAYGLTEANLLVGNCRPFFDAKPGSMGKPYPGHDIGIVDGAGNELPPGELGELVVEPPDPAIMVEYWNDPEATRSAFLDDGRLLTGDLARLDEDGYLWHAGRTDDLIITAGYRVSPLEVEEALVDCPGVSNAVVGSVPDDERGQRVTAYVLPTEDPGSREPTAEGLRERVRDRLGAHKVPREIALVDSLPETRSGKTDRDALFPG